MKHLAVFLIAILAFSSIYSQSNLPTQDSLLRRIDRLERAHINLELVTKKSGGEIETGIGLFGAGIVATVAGSLIYALAPPKTITVHNNNGPVTSSTTTISAAQGIGIVIAAGGTATWLIGLAKVAIAGRRMRHLNPYL